MSLQPGQIVGQDLSPNANILGTQIADKTLLFRNFSESVFKIVKKESTSIPSFTTGPGAFPINSTSLTIPHGLSYVPLVQVYVAGQLIDIVAGNFVYLASSYVPFPVVKSGSAYTDYWFPSSGGSLYRIVMNYGIDATNLYIHAINSDIPSSSDTILSIPLTYFLLQQTAN